MFTNKTINVFENPNICFHRADRHPDTFLLGVNKNKHELMLVDCKVNTIWNHIKAFFGYGDLAGVDLHIQTVGRYIEKNWQTIELSKQYNPKFIDNISKITRHCPYLDKIQKQVDAHNLQFQQIKIIEGIGFNFSESKDLLIKDPAVVEVAQNAQAKGLENLVVAVINKINAENNIDRLIAFKVLKMACQLENTEQAEVILNILVAMYERPEMKNRCPPSFNAVIFELIIEKCMEFEPADFRERWEVAQSFGKQNLRKCLEVLEKMEKLPVETLKNLNFINFVSPEFENNRITHNIMDFRETPEIIDFLAVFQPLHQQLIINSWKLPINWTFDLLPKLTTYFSNLTADDRSKVLDWLAAENTEYDRQKFFRNYCPRLTPQMLDNCDLVLSKHFSISNAAIDVRIIDQFIECLNRGIGTAQILQIWEQVQPFLSLDTGILQLTLLSQNNLDIDWKQLIEDIRPILVENNSIRNYGPICYFSSMNANERLERINILTKWFKNAFKNQDHYSQDLSRLFKHDFNWQKFNEFSIEQLRQFAPWLDDFMDKPELQRWEDKHSVLELLEYIEASNSFFSEKIFNYRQLYENDYMSNIIILLNRFKMCRNNIPTDEIEENHHLIEPGFPAIDFKEMIFRLHCTSLEVFAASNGDGEPEEIKFNSEQSLIKKLELLGQMVRGENEYFNKLEVYWLKKVSEGRATPLPKSARNVAEQCVIIDDKARNIQQSQVPEQKA